MLFLLLLGGVFFLGKIRLTVFKSSGLVGGESFKVSNFWGNMFLNKVGIAGKFKKIDIEFTAEDQNDFIVYSRGVEKVVLRSADYSNENGILKLKVQYHQSQIEGVTDIDESIARDLYVFICQAHKKDRSNVNECMVTVNDYFDEIGPDNARKLVKMNRGILGFEFSFVKKAWAAAPCSGTLDCGVNVWQGVCEWNSYKTCYFDTQCPNYNYGESR